VLEEWAARVEFEEPESDRAMSWYWASGIAI